MIYLITGANGAGKTLNALKWVRDQQLKESRPVYYNGRFEMVADFGWIKFDFKDWQTLPDGAICFIDECHNDMPVRGNSAPVPDAIKMLAEHRRRGFDFYLITQHPQNIDLFVRRLIGSPGWHRHLKRTFGVNMVSCLEWNAVNSNCEKAGAGKDAKISMIAFPKEVYGWYNSAMLHTGKKAIPKQVFFLAAAAVLIPTLFYFTFQKMMPKSAPLKGMAGTSTVAPFTPSNSLGRDAVKVLTPAEYAQSFTPRIEGFPGSASRYDGLNQPTQSPKPAACIMGKRPGQKTVSCACWSQQATLLQVPDSMCRQIAGGGWFDDTLQAVNSKSDGAAPSLIKTSQNAGGAVGINSGPLLPPPDTKSNIDRDGEVLRFMRKREYAK